MRRVNLLIRGVHCETGHVVECAAAERMDAHAVHVDRNSVQRDRPGLVDIQRAPAKGVIMPKTRVSYSPKFRRQMANLARAGRDPDDLARKSGPTAQSIRD